MSSLSRPIPLVIKLNGRQVESETICVWDGAHALTIVTTLPATGLEFEVTSAFIGDESVATHATPLFLGPPGQRSAISTEEHGFEGLDPGIREQDCMKEHIEIMWAHLTGLRYDVATDMPDDAFDEPEPAEC